MNLTNKQSKNRVSRQKNNFSPATEDSMLYAEFEQWLESTAEPFVKWEFDGENYLVFVPGGETEVYEPALVRELVSK